MLGESVMFSVVGAIVGSVGAIEILTDGAPVVNDMSEGSGDTGDLVVVGVTEGPVGPWDGSVGGVWVGCVVVFTGVGESVTSAVAGAKVGNVVGGDGVGATLGPNCA